MINNVKVLFGGDIFEKTKLTADSGFSSQEVLELLEKEKIDAYIPDNRFRKDDEKFNDRSKYKDKHNKEKRKYKTKFYGIQDFKYDEIKDEFICPTNETLYKTGKPTHFSSAYIVQRYNGRDSKCAQCNLRSKCIRGGKNIVKQLYVNVTRFHANNKKSLKKKMREKLDSIKGSFIYSRRMGAVEPVFAQICHLMKLHYFTMRGKKKVHSQWNLFVTVHNIKKLFKLNDSFA